MIDFEWDQSKRAANVLKHGIDFDDAIRIFDGLVFTRQSDQKNEERFVAIGEFDEVILAVVFTLRGDTRRIISARRARPNEKRDYCKTLGRRPP